MTLPPGYYRLVEAQPDFFTLAPGWIRKAADASRIGAALAGELRMVVVPALFSDSPDPPHTASDIQRVYFDGPYVNGTLAEYYDEISGGRLQIVGEVVPWVRTSRDLAAVVGSSWGLGQDAQIGAYLTEALGLVDSATDFGEFDNDGPDGIPNSGDDDGYVDAIAFEFAEVAASCGGPAIWPHRSTIRSRVGAPYATDDPTPAGPTIRIDGYTIQSVVTCDGSDIHTASTMAHELGHVLGLPDIRHHVGGILPDQRRWLIGCFGLMSGGSWGCVGSTPAEWVGPSHMSPWEKLEMGWLGSVEIAPSVELTEIVLEPVQFSEQVLKVPLAGNEHLLIEFRDTIGFDHVLPASGVLVYHIDPGRTIVPCSTCPEIYGVYLMEADGRGDLLRTPREGGNRGEASDMFAITGPGILTNATVPSTRLNTGQKTDVRIRIVVEDGVAHVVISTAPFAIDRLLQSFLVTDADWLRQQELEFLDDLGNRNGRYDVGDLRAYLNR